MDLVSDSTSKILGHLEPRNFLSIYPHSSVPCHNLHPPASVDKLNSTESLFQLFCKLSYSASYPLPMFLPTSVNRQIINGLDPLLTPLKEKHLWEKYKAHLMKYCSSAQAESCESRMKTKDKVKIPYNILLLANHMSKDPDRYLTSNYNVYYNGGNISWFEDNCKKYLVRPKGDDSGKILVDELPDDITIAPEDGVASLIVNTETSGPVYQIESSNSFLVSRHKRRVCIFSVRAGRNNLEFKKEYSVNSSDPFYSVALNSNTFCTVSANREIEIYDVNEEKSLLKGEVGRDEGVHVSDNWCSAHYVNSNVICFIDRTSVSYIDLRVKTDVMSRWCIGERVEHCEEIYCGCKGREERDYVVTSHQALMLDQRAGFLQRWTHGITSTPSYISIVSSQLTDKVLIGSQRSNTLIFIENSSSSDDPVSSSHPYSLPSLVDTFHMARYHGYCLENIPSSRFFMSTTGICLLETSDELSVIRQTSIGDVFYQRLSKSPPQNDSALTNEELGLLEEWQQSCEDILITSEKFSPIQQILSDEHLVECLTNSNEEYVDPNQIMNSTSWKISKKELLSYCDYLAPRILNEWGIEELEEWAEDVGDGTMYEEPSSDESEDITETVARWYQTYREDSDEIHYSFHEIPSEDTGNVQPDLDEDSLRRDGGQRDSLVPTSTPLPKHQKQPISSVPKHTTGF